MKVFFDCTFLRNKHTGVDIYFLNLIKHLLSIDDKNSYIILIDTRYNASDLTDQIKGFNNFKLKRIYSILPLQVIYSSFFIPFYLLFKRIDVYHNPYFFGPILKFICPSTKIVITVHDLYHHTVPHLMNKYLNLIFKTFADNAIKLADEVIVISDQTKSDLVKYLHVPLSRVNLIYQALNEKLDAVTNNKEDVLEKFGLRNRRYILTVGKILPSKGIDELIKAYNIFQNESKAIDISLVSVGMQVGSYFFEIKKLIDSLELPLESIKMLGYVDNGDLIELYRHACMIVVPSYYEGFGLPLLEAMKFEKPIIARNASSLSEVVGDAGLLFNTVDELAFNIHKLFIEDDLSKDLVERGKRRLKQFSWKSTAKQTLAVYNKAN